MDIIFLIEKFHKYYQTSSYYYFVFDIPTNTIF